MKHHGGLETRALLLTSVHLKDWILQEEPPSPRYRLPPSCNAVILSPPIFRARLLLRGTVLCKILL